MTTTEKSHATPLPGTANGDEDPGKSQDNGTVPEAPPTETTPAETPQMDPDSKPDVDAPAQ